MAPSTTTRSGSSILLILMMLLLGSWATVITLDSNNDCPLEKWSLEERHNRSQVVFTAVIESEETTDSIDVRVKKVFKGLDRLWEGRLVRVEGLKNPALCPSRVRLRDTRIFLASHPDVNQTSSVTTPPDESDPLSDHHPEVLTGIRLRLNSSLISVSLRHLQQLRAFSKGILH